MRFGRITVVVREGALWLLLGERFEVVGSAGSEALALSAALASGNDRPLVVHHAA